MSRHTSTIARAEGGILILLATLLLGCATPDPNRRIHVGINHQGVVSVEGRPTTLQDLPRQVRSEGGTRNTWIIVAADEAAPPAAVERVRTALTQGGYPKIMLALARNPSLSVATGTPPASATAPAKQRPAARRTR